MLIKGELERKLKALSDMLLYCHVYVTVISYHQPSGQCSGNEVQGVSQVILHSGGVHVCVYICVYIHMHLHSVISFQFHC